MESCSKIDVLYNGACPICGAEIAHYQRYASEHGLNIRFEDLQSSDLQAWQLDPERAAKRLHVRQNGQIVSGVAAFVALWREMPRYRWIARIVSVPGLNGVADLVYNRVLAPLLYKAHLRRQARSAAR